MLAESSMPQILIDQEKCDLCSKCIEACPFLAIDKKEDILEINANCKMCKLCVNVCPLNALTYQEKPMNDLDLNSWSDILVVVQCKGDIVDPITYELIGKALELVKDNKQKVHCVLASDRGNLLAKSLLGFGLEKILVFEDECYKDFKATTYSETYIQAVKLLKPSVVLIGATPIGRCIAPMLSTFFESGLTADCTALNMLENGNLVQIRPAFGGDIMAQIITAKTRPQFATVRYKTMDRAISNSLMDGEIINCEIPKFKELIKILQVTTKELSSDICEEEIIIAVGRGVKRENDLFMFKNLATKLNGQLACSRPLLERGWFPYTKQIGLSGRTVKPKLIITCGISGAVQFTAAMKESLNIIAINSDENAPIFNIAHLAIVGDIYKVVPMLVENL